MLNALLLLGAGAIAASVYFILAHRRHTPWLSFDIAALPRIEEAMPMLAGLTASTVHEGNAARICQNGAIFDAMFADIEAARHTVELETFVWQKGDLERQFVALLTRKAREGVVVRVLLDAVGGSGADGEQLTLLRAAGVQLELHGFARKWNLRRFNHRTHRKLLIVDGAIGYTFGHGIGDAWTGNAQDSAHCRDTGVRVEGPAVQALQSVFMENWIEDSQCVPAGNGCFPKLERRGDVSAHVVSSATGDSVSEVALLYTIAIACAREEVIIQNPYFAPDDGVCRLLEQMAARGVKVHLMVPGRYTDSPFVRRAGCALYGRLVEAGVLLYEYQPNLLHQKIVIVDRVWSHVGSTNFDSRSLALNEEVGIGLCSREIAAELHAAYLRDLQHCEQVTVEQWRKRSRWDRMLDWGAYQLHDQL